MGTRLSNRFINEKIKFAKNGEGRIEIPRDNPIRAILVWLQVKVNAGSSAPTGRKNNHYLNVAKKIKLERDGSENKFALSAITKYFVDHMENGVKPYESDVTTPAASGSATYNVQLQFDFAQVRRNPSDFTALLNNDLSSLDLIIEWADINAIFGTPNGATVDTDETYAQVEIQEVFENGAPAPQSDPGIEAYLNNGLDYKETEETVHAIEQEHGSFDLDEQIIDVKPVPVRIIKEMWRCLKNITDGDPSESNDIITHFKFANIRGRGESIWRARFLQAWAATKQLLALDTLPDGILWFDWLMLRQGGFRNNVSEASKIKLLTKAPASGKKNGLVIWRRYLVTGQIGG